MWGPCSVVLHIKKEIFAERLSTGILGLDESLGHLDRWAVRIQNEGEPTFFRPGFVFGILMVLCLCIA